MNNAKPILVVGSIALDTLETSSGNRSEIFAGSAVYFSVAASLFAPVRMVGVVGDDFPKSCWDILSSRKIDVQNVQIQNGKTFRWGARYSSDYNKRETLFTHLGVFENFCPEISDNHLNTPFIFLGNIQPDLQKQVSDLTPMAEHVICDTMNLWIHRNVDKLWKVLKGVKIFLLNDEEAIQLTGYNDLNLAAEHLLKAGPKIVIIKRGAKGALLTDGNNSTHIPVYPEVDVVDPTGAGDSFAGGLIGHLANHGINKIREAVITGAAMASFTVSGFGLEGLMQATIEKIEKRTEIIRKSIIE